MATSPADRLARIRAAVDSHVPEIVDLTAKIAAIPAPTGAEHERAAFVAKAFRDAGLRSVAVDDLGDVVAKVPAAAPPRQDGATPVLLAAHLDTVFPAGTRLDIQRHDGRLAGPGVGDNCVGVASLLLLPKILASAGLTPATDLLLTGNVGEEGLGNLRGMRAVMDAHPAIGAAVAVEGHNLGRVTHVAVGSRRLRVSVRGPGGHSWGDYGRPSAIDELARFVSQVAALSIPSSPKTTSNIGLIEGGVSVNTIAPLASCVVDLRSVDPQALGRLASQVEQAAAGLRGKEIDVVVDVLGERPAGVVPLDSPIVRRAVDILASLGIEAVCDASSTDANIPISRGIPALCVGLTHGGNVHRDDEFILTDPLRTGVTQLVSLALALADDVAAGTLASPRPERDAAVP